MNNLKDLYNSAKIDLEKQVGTNKYFTTTQALTESAKLQNKFISNVDFSEPANFARFGLAEEYYKNAINYISQEYPYDGSKAQKAAWLNNLSDFEFYLLKEEYPKYYGYLDLTSSQYVGIFSPSRDLSETSIKNIYRNGEKYFLTEKLNFVDGFTFESWLNFANQTTINNIFNINSVVSESSGLQDVNFLKLFLSSSAIYISSSNNLNNFDYTVDSSNWHHYAVSFNSASASLYVDGELKKQINTATIFNTGSEYNFYKLGMMSASYAYSTTSTGSYVKKPVFLLGSGSQLSIDESRFWNICKTTNEIGRSWFTTIDSNDFENSDAALLFYFKFNEGWNASEGDICLDYSGFKNNSLIYNYNNYNCRVEGSAITASGVVQDIESKDIIYTPNLLTSSLVSSFYDSKIVSGSNYDALNANSLYKKFPSWVIEEDDLQNPKHLRQLIQIVASYFDDLYNKIAEVSKYKHIQNIQDYKKIYPFYDKILTSAGFDVSELFNNLTFIEKIASRTEENLFDEDIQKIKNAIYQNIYNNLSYILKSKGTEKAIKAFLRSYGINENLVKINLYANGAFELKDKYSTTSLPKKTIKLVGDESIFLSSSNIISTGSNNTFTLESSTIFPYVLTNNAPQTSSICGYFLADSSDYFAPTGSKLQAYITLEQTGSGHKFCFRTGSNKELVGSSSIISNIYDDTVWNFAISIKPNVDNIETAISTSNSYNYLLNFRAFNQNRESLLTFDQTVTSSALNTSNFYSGSVRYFIGAEKNNLTGSTINNSNAKYLYCNYWSKYLTDEEILNHNKDVMSYGAE